MQSLVLNHLKVLCSKGMVLNVQVTITVRVMELNASELLMTCRKDYLLTKLLASLR